MSGASEKELERLRLRVAELEAALASDPRTALGEALLLPATLRAREAKLAEAERVAKLGTWIWDTRTQLVTWSPELYRILGYDPETIQPSVEKYYAAVHPDDVARVRAISVRNSETGESAQMMHRIRQPSGAVRDVIVDGAPIRDSNGALLGFAGTVLDVTDRNQAQRALVRSEALLAAAQAMARVGSWAWDLTTGATEWSDELCRITGVERGTPITRKLWLEMIHPDDRSVFNRELERVVQGETLDSVELRLLRKDGEIRWIRCTARAFHDEQGRRVGYSGIVHDYTRERRLEDQLRESQKMEAIGRVAAGVAHDFNNVLTVIRGNVDLLMLSSPSEELGAISEAVARAAGLTRLLLTLGRKAPAAARELDLGEEVSRSIRLVSRLVAKNVSLEVDVKQPLWPVIADPTQVHQVVSNLVLNANDAMPGGGPLTVRLENVVLDAEYARAHPDAQIGEHVAIEVQDRGAGMTDYVRAHALEPFFTTKQPGKGTGLGLPTVFGIVRQSGGSLDIGSVVGRGTVVRVFLPRSQASAAVQPK